MNKLFNKKNNMQQIYDYPYYAEKQLRDGWKVKCSCYRENSNRLFDYILKVINSQGAQIGFMNLETYETCKMREHMRTICENPDEYIVYTQCGERHMHWDISDNTFEPIPFEVVWELYPWIESQMQVVSNLFNKKTYCEGDNRFDKDILEEFTIDIKDEEEKVIVNIATIKI